MTEPFACPGCMFYTPSGAADLFLTDLDNFGAPSSFRAPLCDHACREVVRKLAARKYTATRLEYYIRCARNGGILQLEVGLSYLICKTGDLSAFADVLDRSISRFPADLLALFRMGPGAALAVAPPSSERCSVMELLAEAIHYCRPYAPALMDAFAAAGKDLSACDCWPADRARDEFCECSLYYAAATALDPEVFRDLLRRGLVPGSERFRGIDDTGYFDEVQDLCLVGHLALMSPIETAMECLEVLFEAGVPRRVRADGGRRVLSLRNFAGVVVWESGRGAARVLELDAEFSRWTELRAAWVAATLWRARA